MARSFLLNSILLVFFVAFSHQIYADGIDTFNEAEVLFSRRAEGVKYIHEAKSIYHKLIKNKRESLVLRKIALDRYARLAIFEGEVARQKFHTKDAKKIFNECIDVTDYLSPKHVHQETAEHTYWRAMCIGLWIANADKSEVVWHFRRVEELNNLVDTGIKKFKTFDEYGFNRIKAGMYIRSKSFTWLGLYQPGTALSLLNEALAYSNTNNFIVYILKAEALIELGNRSDARVVLLDGIDELKRRMALNNLPMELLAENYAFFVRMFEMLDALN